MRPKRRSFSKVSHSNQRPILRFDRSHRGDIPEGPTFVQVDRETYVFDFKKIAVNVATREGSRDNVLPTLLRRWLGATAGLAGTRHEVQLVRVDDEWRLEPMKAVATAAATSRFPQLPYYPDLAAACGALDGATPSEEQAQMRAAQTEARVDAATHFLVRASGDSMAGGERPIAHNDLVLCEWTPNISLDEIEGHPTLLVGTGTAMKPLIAIKVPRRDGRNGWVLESWNAEPQKVPKGMKLVPVARALEVVSAPIELPLWGEFDRDSIAASFGSVNNPSWKVGHRDIDVDGAPHTILMVTLRKAGQTRVEHRYADQFTAPDTMEWESQASTKVEGAKGQRIIHHEKEGRTIHLFVQYDAHSPFTYLGPVVYQRHEGELPMHVVFKLTNPLPDSLWKLWGR